MKTRKRHPGWTPGLIALALVAVALTGATARASMALAVSLRELVERADHIVLVRAVAKESLHDEHGRIVTDVEVVVEQSEKGSTRPGDSLVVRSLGGVVGDIGSRVVGAPVLELGEQQLIFAIDDPGGSVVHALELSQGVMRIFEKDGRRWTHGGGEGLALRKRAPDGALGPAAHTADRPLAEVLGDVRALLSGSR